MTTEQLTIEFSQAERSLAEEIKTTHAAASGLVDGAKQAIEDAITASLRCAAMVDAARSEWGGKFPDIWRELVGLAPLDARRYISLHSTAQRCLDKRQLVLAGIIEQPEQEDQESRPPADPFAWCRWVPRIVEAMPDEVIERMTFDQKAVAAKTLEPAHKLWLKLQPTR